VAKGLYILNDGSIIVDFGSRKIAIPRAQYRANGYKPAVEQLLNGDPPAKCEPRGAGQRRPIDPAKTTRT
jgi:hypothetical protein